MIEKIEINLIPAEYRVHSNNIAVKKEILIPSLITAILIVVSLGWVNMLDKQLVSKQIEIDKNAKELKSYAREKKELDNLRTSETSMNARKRGLSEINIRRDRWVRMLEDYSRDMPINTWLLSIEESGGVITIKGITEAFAEVGQYIAKLKSNGITDLRLIEIRDKSKMGKVLEFELKHNVKY